MPSTRDSTGTGVVVRPALDPLESFVAEHYGRLLRLAALVCRNGADAEDAVQAALERAWRSRNHLLDPQKLRPWLDRIIVREASRLIRSRARVADLSVVPEPGAAPHLDEAAAVRLALSKLRPDQRAVVALHLYAGYTVEATADLLGVSSGTVRSRLQIARAHLRRALGEEEA
jgi:RNA polymerase sigma-70 factor (ECF subfamily)